MRSLPETQNSIIILLIINLYNPFALTSQDYLLSGIVLVCPTKWVANVGRLNTDITNAA